jgi:hypothetical protein
MTRAYPGTMEFARVPGDLDGADWDLLHQTQPKQQAKRAPWPGQDELERLGKRFEEKRERFQTQLMITPEGQQASMFERDNPANDAGFVADLEEFEKRHRGGTQFPGTTWPRFRSGLGRR